MHPLVAPSATAKACIQSVDVESGHMTAGAQVLVAWSLQRSLPNKPFSMVAEEDSADLRYDEASESDLPDSLL